MDNQLLGGLIGLAVGIAGYVTVGHAIGQIEARSGNQRDPDTERMIRILKAVRLFDLVVVPVACYFAFGMIDRQLIG
jgi:hypothetical protein